METSSKDLILSKMAQKTKNFKLILKPIAPEELEHIEESYMFLSENYPFESDDPGLEMLNLTIKTDQAAEDSGCPPCHQSSSSNSQRSRQKSDEYFSKLSLPRGSQ